MVFYDRFGLRKHYVWGFTLALIVAGVICAALIYVALSHPPKVAALSYTNLEGDTRFDKTIALTFDDGPDPTYTPRLLELLKREGVPATFFLIGESVVEHPAIAKSIVDSGFEIGNHTFTHAESVNRNETRIRNELITTDRVIRDATGRSPILFRPPFLEDVDVGEFDGGRLAGDEIRWAENAGFIVVGANLDTRDWNVEQGQSDIILERLNERMKTTGPTVVIMHDMGGKGASIDALETFIPAMKAQGYRFVYVSEYFGLTPDEAMPVAGGLSKLDSVLVGAAKTFVHGTSTFNAVIFFVSVLALIRLWMILAARRMYVPYFARVSNSLSRPPVSVLVPAYNEEANIEAALRSVFAGLGEDDEVIVIDDGSTDATASIVRSLSFELGSRLVLLQKENGGTKGGALMYGLPFARHEILVCIDGDTVIDRYALHTLARHFDDPMVGAVAGKIYPARVISLLSAFQYLEYMQGQNIDKEVFAALNAIGVVPGAIGAWRASAVKAAGGYSLDTVVEDQDLTMAILAEGYRITFEPSARAYTETPDTVRLFFRQRTRWVFGTIQCVWKYRGWFFSVKRPALGLVILPNVLFFNLLTPLMVPLTDFMVILGLMGTINIWAVLMPFIIFTLLDIWCAIEGLTYEHMPPRRLIPLVVWQRFFYRYVLAAVVIRSFGMALAGTFVAWGAQSRRGDCHPAFEVLETEPLLTPSPIQLAPQSPTLTPNT